MISVTGLLATLIGIRAPYWYADALCADLCERGDADPSWWDDEAAPEAVARGRAICAECPVRVECLTAATTQRRTEFLIYGGLTPFEREIGMRRERALLEAGGQQTLIDMEDCA